MQLGGLWSVLDWMSHQGIRQSKLCYIWGIYPYTSLQMALAALGW